MSVTQYKWPNQFDQSVEAPDTDRDYYKFGDSILIWDESNEEIQTLGKYALAWSHCFCKLQLNGIDFHFVFSQPF